MKRISLAFLLIASTCILSACSWMPGKINRTTKTPATTGTTYATAVSIDALHFSSEQEMINEIKSGKITNSEHQLETVEYFFRLHVLPANAKLTNISVKAFYIALDYVIDDQVPDMKSNMITFVWYRTMRGDQMKNGFTKAGLPWAVMAKNASYSFYTSENLAYNRVTGKLDENLPKEQMCQVVMWVQDDFDFQVNAPLWFTETDALKYCVAEQVPVK
jgi:hypothetical protein